MLSATDFERLVHAVEVATGRGERWASRPDPLVAPGEANEQLRALFGLLALQRYVQRWLTALDGAPVGTTRIAASAQDAAERIEESASVLREVLAGLPVDGSALPADRAPVADDLVRARARGEILAVACRFEERLAAVRASHERSTRWTVVADEYRRYEAHSDDGVRVRAWSSLPGAIESELCTWSTPPARPEIHYPAGRPTGLPERLVMTEADIDRAPGPNDTADGEFERYMQDYAAGQHARRVEKHLTMLRSRLAVGEAEAFYVERCASLNATSAQLPRLTPDPDGLQEWHTWSGANMWVDPRSIVRTADPEDWGTISRERERAGKVWIPAAIRQWLTTDDIPGLLREAMTAGSPVQLHRLPGPSGPLHTQYTDGTHRTHLFRILDAPAIFAYVNGLNLPTQLTPADVCGPDAESEALHEVAEVWAGLYARGVVRGSLHVPGWRGCRLDLTSVPAIWLLYPPRLAAAYGRRYAEIYPGAWERVGIPSAAFGSPESWVAWCGTPPS